MWDMHGVGAGWWILMSIGMIAFWAAVIFLVVWLVRGAPTSRPDEQQEKASETPVELLGRRLAEGNISIEEYNERRAALEQQPRMPDPPLPV